MKRLPSARSFLFVATTVLTVTSFVRTGQAAAQLDLSSRRASGQLTRVTLSYQVVGSLAVPAEDKPTNVPLAVKASASYDERIVESDITAARDQEIGQRVRRRSVRHYDRVQAELAINGQKLQPTLEKAVRLIGASIRDGARTIYSPQGPLSREELDLLQWPGDSLVVDLVLPRQRVSVGSKWQIDSASLALLLGLDSVGESNVQAELKEVSARYATIEAEGNALGVVDGAATSIGVRARGHFDRQRGMLTSLQLITKEKRQVGEVSPGIDAAAKTKITVVPLRQSVQLGNRALSGVRLTPDARARRLRFQAGTGLFQIAHGRDWFVTQDDKFASILRRMDDGEMIAQCNISTLPIIAKGKEISLDAFRDDVRSSLGDTFGRFIQASQSTDNRGRLVYRVEAGGQVADVPIRWVYYLMAGTDGQRAAVVFTMEDSLVERFGTADQQILADFEFSTTKDDIEPEAVSATNPAKSGRSITASIVKPPAKSSPKNAQAPRAAPADSAEPAGEPRSAKRTSDGVRSMRR